MKFSGQFSLKSAIFLISLSIQFGNGLSGDPCPNKNDLWPCTCAHVPVVLENADILGMKTEVTHSIESSTDKSVDAHKKFNFLIPKPSPTPLIMAGRNNTFYTVVTCKSPKSISVLEDAITRGLHRKWVDRLTISHLPPKMEHTLAELPARLLRNVRLSQIEIRDSIMAGDFINEGNPFEGQSKNLLWFTASDCFLSGKLTYDVIGTTNTKGLNLLARVEGVDFSRNHIVYIDTNAFRYPPANLSIVNLSYNNIKGVDGGSFQFIPKLRYLDISHNLLKTIHRAIFASPAKNLRHIDFSWNSLTSLPADFFIGMPALQTVNLKSNFLSALPEKPWQPIWRQLSLIQLTGNFLECDCELLWLLNILSPSKVNATSTPPPKPLPNQRVLGSCGHTGPQHFKIPYKLTSLTRANINCD